MTLGMPTTTHPGDELRDSAIRQLGMAAKALNLDPGMHKYLATPERTLIVSVPVCSKRAVSRSSPVTASSTRLAAARARAASASTRASTTLVA